MAVENFAVDIIVGSRIGTVKHVEYDEDPKAKCKIKQLNSTSELSKGEGIACMCWSDETETRLITAKDNGIVATYDLDSDAFTRLEGVNFGEGKPVGIASLSQSFVGASSSGTVKLWNSRKQKELSSIDVGGPLDKFISCAESPSEFAVGGKENDLTVWNLDTKQSIFKAKNVPHDWLELRVPIWVSDICFLPGNDGKLIATCSRYGYVRLYDTRTQRRPLCSIDFESQAGSCIANGHRERHVLVGTGRGILNLVDLRKKGKLEKAYKGTVGAITQVTCDRNKIISTSLDRYLRIHDAESNKLIYNQYLTTKLTRFLLRKPTRIKIEKNEEEEITEVEDQPLVTINEGESSDPEYETIFDNMEVIRERPEKEDEISAEAMETQAKTKRKNKRKKKQSEEEVKTNPQSKKMKVSDIVDDNDPALEDDIRKLLKSTEKQKRKLEKKKKEKKAKSLFSK